MTRYLGAPVQKACIFVSSSSDLADTRCALADDLSNWIRRNGVDDVVAPYLWEEATVNGRMVSERLPIQQQLRDPYADDVPFTICLFAERCGVPLKGDMPPEWLARIEPWCAGADGRGLIHPWPETTEDQDAALDKGGFPLTGTVFELISAHAQDDRLDNLITGYIANGNVSEKTGADDVFFNEERLWRRIAQPSRSARERNALRDEVYKPQIRALINLLRYLNQRGTPVRQYASEASLQREILRVAKDKMRAHFNLHSPDNPFKSTLEHWTIDDEKRLPGRNRLVDDIVKAATTGDRQSQKNIILIKGRSGCGKSSILHRGVLARIRDNGGKVVPFRPLDLLDPLERDDNLDVLWKMVGDTIESHEISGFRPGWVRREDKMAKCLDEVLRKRRTFLVFGIDQFEEILDDLRTTKANQKKGWWPVMRFFGALAKSPRVQLIATMESSRWQTYKNLNVENTLKVGQETFDADTTADQVADIAQQGFSSAGLPLEKKLLEAIKEKWTEFEAGHSQDGLSASPLPLACLWFAQLYDRFEDRAGKIEATGDGLRSAALSASTNEPNMLTLDDLGEEGVSFDQTIAKLADEAWREAGGRQLDSEISDEAFASLTSFLQPLVALDDDGHKRLLPVPEVGIGSLNAALRAQFKAYRLLVPAASNPGKKRSPGPALLRLVHQSVIDRWPPAAKWFARRQDYLQVENSIRLDAKRWAARGRVNVKATREQIQEAAQVLNEYRIDWPGRSDDQINRENRQLRAYALHIFSQAQDGTELISSSTGGNLFVHLAACYHLVTMLEAFEKARPGCLMLESKLGNNPLMQSAWVDGPAVPFLLERNVPMFPHNSDWSAFAAALQTNANENYRAMVERIDDVNQPIGPHGITMLMMAAQHGNSFALEDLLQRGADPLQPAEWRKWTPLHWAALNGQAGCFTKLLTLEGAKLQDKFDQTPFTLAADRGNISVLRELMSSEDLETNAVLEVLSLRDKAGDSPVMRAAFAKRPDVVSLLLEEYPELQSHVRDDESNLLHLAAMAFGEAGDGLHLRARKTVEVILARTDLDPTAKNKRGQTPYDLAHGFEDVRRVLREDPRMPTTYEDLTPSMRIADLTSRKINRALELIRKAPQALTDEHEGKTGLDHLIRSKNVRVLTVGLNENLIGEAQVRAKLDQLLELAGSKDSAPLRGALMRRLLKLEGLDETLAKLLDQALRHEARDEVELMWERGITEPRGVGSLALTAFHEAAIVGAVDRFRTLAEIRRFKLPLDGLGRRPSDLCAEKLTSEFTALEGQCFDPPGVLGTATKALESTKFHDFARRGDVKAFARQAQGVHMLVPHDAEGRKPSDVAKDEVRDEILQLENRYFAREN